MYVCVYVCVCVCIHIAVPPNLYPYINVSSKLSQKSKGFQIFLVK